MKSKPLLAQSKSQAAVNTNKAAVKNSALALLLEDGERFDADYEDSIILFCLDFIVHALEELKSQCCFFVVLELPRALSFSTADAPIVAPPFTWLQLRVSVIRNHAATPNRMSER